MLSTMTHSASNHMKNQKTYVDLVHDLFMEKKTPTERIVKRVDESKRKQKRIQAYYETIILSVSFDLVDRRLNLLIFFLWKQFSYVRINKFLNIWHWNVKISFQWIVMHILQYYFWSITRYLIRTSFFLLIFWEISSVAQLRWIKFSFDSIFFCLTLPQITHWRERERQKKTTNADTVIAIHCVYLTRF